MRLPSIQGLIRRRILVSFRVDPEVAARQLPPPFRPQVVEGAAIAGLCLIRLEQMRPPFMPMPAGLCSENAAHRCAVCWTDEHGEERAGVYIPRRDTDSLLNRQAGGRLFPGVSHRARFRVRDRAGRLDFAIDAEEDPLTVRLRARVGEEWPVTSCFASLEQASAFYQAGSVGFSPAIGGRCVEGMALETTVWQVEPLAVESVYSSYFADERRFPRGSVVFDSALLMRNIPHAWKHAPGVKESHRSQRNRTASAAPGSPAAASPERRAPSCARPTRYGGGSP